MKMRYTSRAFACALALGIPGLASAGDMSLNHFQNHALPVLVTVNSHGKITEMSPAYSLRPRMHRLLKHTLDQMITGPAKDHGKGISSQAVFQMAVESTKQDDGKYKVHFAYVKAMPVPYGKWFWNHIDGHRLALESDNGRMFRRYPRHYVPDLRAYPRSNQAPPQTASHNQPQPVQRSAPMPQSAAPVSVPARTARQRH